MATLYHHFYYVLNFIHASMIIYDISISLFKDLHVKRKLTSVQVHHVKMADNAKTNPTALSVYVYQGLQAHCVK